MTADVINKISISAEAVFDYSEALALGVLNKRALKAEAEEYLDRMNRAGRLRYEKYIRCQYFDIHAWRMLTLFLYRAERVSVLQTWDLQGLCFAEDWTENLEESGKIRDWLKSKITDESDGDWVIEQRIRAETDKILCGWSVRGRVEGLPAEVKNAIEFGSNHELVEAVSFLQNAVGKRNWRKYFEREAVVPRKVNKRSKRRRV